MNTIEQALVHILQNTPAVTALFGATPLRIYPVVIAQTGAYPKAAYQRISTPRVRSLRAKSKTQYPRIQFTIQAVTQANVLEANEVLRTTLELYSGTVGDVVIQSIMWRDFDNVEYNPEAKIYEFFSEITVWHHLVSV